MRFGYKMKLRKSNKNSHVKKLGKLFSYPKFDLMV